MSTHDNEANYWHVNPMMAAVLYRVEGMDEDDPNVPCVVFVTEKGLSDLRADFGDALGEIVKGEWFSTSREPRNAG